MNRAAALAACALLGACATPGGRAAPTEPVEGYLAADALQPLAALAPPPASGSDRGDLPDAAPTPDRWWLAIAHAELRAPQAAQHFDCVLGTRLAGRPRPALSRMMNRLLADTDAVTRRLAAESHHPRPIAAVPGLQPCQRVDQTVRDSSSWPAGGAVAGAAYGELFAALAPDRAAEARRMGREIGLSRAVCRMNWPTDVAAGQRLGQALYEAAAARPAFAADLEAARAEVAAARAEGLTHPGCAAERRALDQAGRGATSEP